MHMVLIPLLALVGWLGTAGLLWWSAKRLGFAAAAVIFLLSGIFSAAFVGLARLSFLVPRPTSSDPYRDTYYVVVHWHYAFDVAIICLILAAMSLFIDRNCAPLTRRITESAAVLFFFSVGSLMTFMLWLIPVMLGDPDDFTGNGLVGNQVAGFLALLTTVSAGTILFCFFYVLVQIFLRRTR
jgi:heme/copper-type cytochrome/quinol oxidase subunit 1